MAVRVLVVDDEKTIVKGIRVSLEQDDIQVDCAYDGEEALRMAQNSEYDVMVLDLMLPKMDGIEVCRTIREFSDLPIIMLTAKNDEMDKILGLEYGADDYMTKPFNIMELKARIRALIRRSSKVHGRRQDKPKHIKVKDLEMDPENRTVFVRGAEVNLTAKEFDLLELLITNPSKVYTREQLLGLIWGADYPGDNRTVDVHIRRLREKIEANPSDPHYVFTKWGIGYYYKG